MIVIIVFPLTIELDKRSVNVHNMFLSDTNFGRTNNAFKCSFVMYRLEVEVVGLCSLRGKIQEIKDRKSELK